METSNQFPSDSHIQFPVAKVKSAGYLLGSLIPQCISELQFKEEKNIWKPTNQQFMQVWFPLSSILPLLLLSPLNFFVLSTSMSLFSLLAIKAAFKCNSLLFQIYQLNIRGSNSFLWVICRKINQSNYFKARPAKEATRHLSRIQWYIDIIPWSNITS